MTLRISSTMIVTGVLAIAAGGCATSQAASGQQKVARSDNACVFANSLNDYQPIDNERLILWAPGHGQPYLVTLSFPSTELKWGLRVGFEDRDRNGMICGFGQDQVIVPGSIPERISIKSMEPITKEQAKELMDSTRKKIPKEPSADSKK